MVSSLYNGISGIKSHQFAIDTTSNNIANINTTGYRANTTGFKSLFATNLNHINSNSPISNDFNYGATIASNAINANDGSYVSANGDFNVAYSGKGWFVVGLNKNGTFDLASPNSANLKNNFFTRDGSFSLDGEGYLVNSSGYYMYGINLGKIATDGTLTGANNLNTDYAALAGSNLQPLRIPRNLNYKPTLTTAVNLSINLNRTQNSKGIDVLTNDDGTFSMEKFLTRDINTLMNGDGKLLDAKNFNDLEISITKGNTTTKHTFIYGAEGKNGFKTMRELMELVQKVGLTLSLKLDGNGKPTDCSLTLSNNSLEEVTIDIDGKLADKLGFKVKGNVLPSAFTENIATFEENKTFKDGDYVRYNGLIFQKNGDGQTNGNPIDDKAGWNLIDTNATPAYDEKKAKEYAKESLVLFDGKIYRKTTDVGQVTEEDNQETGEKTILDPSKDTANWLEVSEEMIATFGGFEAGKAYAQDSIVNFNGVLYKKINGEGEKNPIDDPNGWRALAVSGVNSTRLQVPTYETNTEIFSDSGKKFILKNQYVLTNQADAAANPPVLESWEVRSEIYDSTGKVLISQNPVISTLSFNPDGSASAEPFDIPFNNGSIKVDLTQGNGKTSSNFAYTDSTAKGVTQDGIEAGVLKEMLINENGILFANFTNGKMEPIGRFGIAAFANDQGLSKVGGNLFSVNARTINGVTNFVSGAPILAWEEGGLANLKYGKVMDHMLETSNVNTGTALTELIIYQRGYQMSAKSITTVDQMMQEAIQLKR